MAKVKIMLDAGHYGKYNKYSGVNAYDSEVMGKLLNYLKKALEDLGFVVGITRTNQAVNLDVAKRGKLAKE